MPPDQPYTGKAADRANNRMRRGPLPVLDRRDQEHPKDYLASENLVAAVNVALELGMPLLLTGEPGCGKSRLADALAYALGFPCHRAEETLADDGEPVAKHLACPIELAVKSDTEGRDLFYRFDTLGRFHAANAGAAAALPARSESRRGKPLRRNGNGIDPRLHVRYQGLGLALLLAKGRDRIPLELMTSEARAGFPKTPRRSVVLIDEIDKAPREVPNDLLTEIENLRFNVPELQHEGYIELSPEERPFRPVVVITSNSEKDLPPAFLRRCVYHHLGLPPFAADGGQDRQPPVTVESIVKGRLGDRFQNRQPLLDDAIALFRFLRDDQANRLRHPVSLAEFLDWLRYLAANPPADAAAEPRPYDFSRVSLGALIKHKDDQAAMPDLIRQWRAAAAKQTA